MTSSTFFKVGVQGAAGSFSEQACRIYCNDHLIKNYEIEFLYTAENVFAALDASRISYGVLAMANNISGVILETVEALSLHTFQLVDVFDIPVSYALLAKKGSKRKDIQKILSHPAILEGCREKLKREYPHADLEAGRGILIDQSAMAAYLSEAGSPNHVAVIAPLAVADSWKLDVLDPKMEDYESFSTFLWCAKR